MRRDFNVSADYLGSYSHPEHLDNPDWTVRIYFAADRLAASTNGDPVWDGPRFDDLLAEYGIDRADLLTMLNNPE